MKHEFLSHVIIWCMNSVIAAIDTWPVRQPGQQRSAASSCGRWRHDDGDDDDASDVAWRQHWRRLPLRASTATVLPSDLNAFSTASSRAGRTSSFPVSAPTRDRKLNERSKTRTRLYFCRCFIIVCGISPIYKSAQNTDRNLTITVCGFAATDHQNLCSVWTRISPKTPRSRAYLRPRTRWLPVSV